ncbi:hypothetical protein N9S81_00280 [bacterium]|nr:hypothetical protein [bacterium]
MQNNEKLLLISSGFLALGLMSILAGSLTFKNISKNRVKDVTERHSVPWKLSGFLGRGSGGSPVFGVAWSLIYTLCAVCAASLLYVGLSKQKAEGARNLCWASLLCFVALILASIWNPIFIQGKGWSFVASSLILFLVAGCLGISTFLINPFSTASLAWFENLTGLFFAFFFGWSLIAFAISLGTTTRFYNRGESRLNDDESSWWPFSLAILIFILCCSFFNGFIAVPLLFSSFFFKGYLRRWQIWSSSLLALLGLVIGVVIMLVTRT